MQEYIPELKKEIERLTKRRDFLLSKKSNNSLIQIDNNQKNIICESSTTSICASPLCNGQILIQISTTQENDFPISEVFGSLEEDGSILLNSSSFKSFGDKIFHSLHFQVHKYYYSIFLFFYVYEIFSETTSLSLEDSDKVKSAYILPSLNFTREISLDILLL